MKLAKENRVMTIALLGWAGMIGWGLSVPYREYKEPVREMNSLVVERINPSQSHYHHLLSGGNEVIFEDQKIDVFFPYEKWDKCIKPGDTIDMKVRKCYHVSKYWRADNKCYMGIDINRKE